MASLEDDEVRLSDDTRRKNGSLSISNQSGFSESLDILSEASKSRDVKRMKITKPSRLPVYSRHHKVNHTHAGVR